MDTFTLSLVIGIIIGLLHFLWKQGTKNFDHYEKRGIPFVKPTPFIGNFGPMFRQKQSLPEFIQNIYNAFPDASITGLFDRNNPIYMIKDPELIKQLGVKDFEHFIDHRQFTDPKSDPLFGNNLVNLTGDKWKDMRATLSPVFTGSKMRQMFDFLPEIGQQMIEYFKNTSAEERVIEMKEMFSRYALDVIATTNFGVKINSMREKENDFFKKTRQLIDMSSFWRTIRITFIVFFPKISNFIKLRIIPKSASNYFEDLVQNTEKARKEQGIVRPDLVHLMMELKKGQLKKDETHDDIGFATVQDADLGKVNQKRKWTDDELMAQAFIFFFAGFETVATAASFTSYELAVNQEVQDKLIDEIDAVVSKLNGKALTYEILQEMKYMDMVISEGLRYWPPADATDRLCVKDYKMKNDAGEDFIVEKGSNLWFPTYGLHFCEKYWENPKKFDPERFSDENKHKIVPGAYLPFGIGPRSCIGSRFALMEIKTAFFYLLRDFKLKVSSKTEIPLKIKVGMTKTVQNGIWLELEPRQK